MKLTVAITLLALSLEAVSSVDVDYRQEGYSNHDESIIITRDKIIDNPGSERNGAILEALSGLGELLGDFVSDSISDSPDDCVEKSSRLKSCFRHNRCTNCLEELERMNYSMANCRERREEMNSYCGCDKCEVHKRSSLDCLCGSSKESDNFVDKVTDRIDDHFDRCSVCGDGLSVTNPDAKFDLPGELLDISCGSLQEAGEVGIIPFDMCGLLTPFIKDTCGCNDIIFAPIDSITSAPVVNPVLAPVNPTSAPANPTQTPISPAPTRLLTQAPISRATVEPTSRPTPKPSVEPTPDTSSSQPSGVPSSQTTTIPPTLNPTSLPTNNPSSVSSSSPSSLRLSSHPSSQPPGVSERSSRPSSQPSGVDIVINVEKHACLEVITAQATCFTDNPTECKICVEEHPILHLKNLDSISSMKEEMAKEICPEMEKNSKYCGCDVCKEEKGEVLKCYCDDSEKINLQSGSLIIIPLSLASLIICVFHFMAFNDLVSDDDIKT